jgi:LysM repeat protein
MKLARVVAVVWLLAMQHASAQEHTYVHVVRAGETLASISQAYYGDSRRDEVLLAENGLDDRTDLLEGMRIVVPVVRYHRAVRGETWRGIAERYYGDPNRAVALLRANGKLDGSPEGKRDGKSDGKSGPDEGAQLLVPHPLRYVAHSNDTYASIAARFYAGRDEGRMLRTFNGGRAKVSRGQLLLVPLYDLVLSAQGLARFESAHGTDPEAAARSSRVQTQVGKELPRLEEHVRAGRFLEAAALGNQLLGRGELTGNQEITIQRQLATAYVALDREDLAITAFASALAKQPDLELDSVRTSPRVLAALEAAKKQKPRVR